MKDVALGLLPRQLREVFERGLLKGLLLLVLLIVVAPPLLAFLAAFWLKELGTFHNPLATSLRSQVLEMIQDGFSVEEVASRSNTRLDYFQLFSPDLFPKIPSSDLRISIQQRQKAVVDITDIVFVTTGPTCSLPESNMDLVVVSLGGQPLGPPQKEHSRARLVVGKNWWDNYLRTSDTDDDFQQLSFRVTEPVRALSCGQIHVQGSVSVFKDLLPGIAAAR
jgi:hypothetical protein